TVGVVIQGGDGKNVDSVLPHIAQRTFDENPAVRSMVSTVVGGWLLDLRDRYSYFHKLLPLLLTGLSDDIQEIQKKSSDLFDKVGQQYEKENEADFKDKQDFQVWDKNVGIEGKSRPCLGCRALIERNLSKILPAILRDMTDWTAGTRIKAASLLYHMLYYAEDNATQHIEALLGGLYKGCRDEESSVVKEVLASAELVGQHVEPAVYLKLCLPHLTSASTTSTQQTASVLKILTATVKGTSDERIKPHLKVVCDAVVIPDVCDTESADNQEQLLCLVEIITSKSGEQCAQYSLQLFIVVLHLMSLQREGMFDEKIRNCLKNIAVNLQFEGARDLYKLHTKDVIEKLKESHTSWTSHSSSRLLFNTLLLNAGPVVGTLLSDIVPMVTVCLNPEKDPELRLKFFSLLSKLSVDSANTINSTSEFPQHSRTVLVDCIIPNLVWKAGRVAIAIRTAAISTLWAILHADLLPVETCNSTLKDLLTQIISCLDDHSPTTRSITSQVLEKLLTLCKDHYNVDLLHSLYPELLKRMDDSSDEIRVFVTKTLLAFFRAFPSDYDKDLYKLHLEAMFKGLLVHLDDSSSHIQEGVLLCLKEASNISPSIMKEQVKLVQHKHRVSRYCDELLQYINNTTTP
ncbi:dynein assembly factor 5, axonemal-like, partial [Paramuricea clavata]